MLLDPLFVERHLCRANNFSTVFLGPRVQLDSEEVVARSKFLQVSGIHSRPVTREMLWLATMPELEMAMSQPSSKETI
jgi:hypothetical protein